jgi:hypothetical protein
MEKISQQLVKMCLDECRKENNKKLIHDEILDPLIMHILEKIQPIIIVTSVYFITTAVMIIILVVLFIMKT